MDDKLLDLKEFTKNYPDFSEGCMDDYTAIILECETTIGKFFLRSKLSKEERTTLGKQMATEWKRDVLEPYMETLRTFCEKWELAPVSEIAKSYECGNLKNIAIEKSLKEMADKLFF